MVFDGLVSVPFLRPLVAFLFLVAMPGAPSSVLAPSSVHAREKVLVDSFASNSSNSNLFLITFNSILVTSKAAPSSEACYPVLGCSGLVVSFGKGGRSSPSRSFSQLIGLEGKVQIATVLHGVVELKLFSKLPKRLVGKPSAN